MRFIKSTPKGVFLVTFTGLALCQTIVLYDFWKYFTKTPHVKRHKPKNNIRKDGHQPASLL